MKTYEIQKYGGPEGLELVDRPLPEPGDHDVVVRIRPASLNYRDLVVIRGRYDRNPREGRVPLSDGAGEVVSVGSAVTRVKVADRVASCFFQGWPSGRFEAAMHRTALGALNPRAMFLQTHLTEEFRRAINGGVRCSRTQVLEHWGRNRDLALSSHSRILEFSSA